MKANNETLKDLRALNFDKLIGVGMPDVRSYTYDDYKSNGYQHQPINGYCISCEKKGCSVANDDSSYRLTNISHGSHASDFFRSLPVRQDVGDWHQDPVMFVYESPSLDYGIYQEVAYLGYKKRPSKEWYWIHEDQVPVSYPERFCRCEYGGFVLSAIRTFQLANVYMTNLVKCGLNNKEGGFKGLASFQEATIRNCYEEFLSKEIEILKPKIIFAAGSAVEGWVQALVGDTYFVQKLPHPAGRGISNEHYKTLYYWGIARALHRVGIIDTEEGKLLAQTYLEKYEKRQVFIELSTTGVDLAKGERIVEIGCLEMIDGQRTGRVWQQFLNPECELSAMAVEVNACSNAFLADKPRFADVVLDLLHFLRGAELIGFLSSYILGCLNAELERFDKNAGRIEDICTVTDMMTIAKKIYPNFPEKPASNRDRDESSIEYSTTGSLRECEKMANAYQDMMQS